MDDDEFEADFEAAAVVVVVTVSPDGEMAVRVFDEDDSDILASDVIRSALGMVLEAETEDEFREGLN